MGLDYLIHLCAFAIAIFGIVGNGWDKNKKGKVKFNFVGWSIFIAAFLILFCSIIITYQKNKKASFNRENVYYSVCNELKDIKYGTDVYVRMFMKLPRDNMPLFTNEKVSYSSIRMELSSYGPGLKASLNEQVKILESLSKKVKGTYEANKETFGTKEKIAIFKFNESLDKELVLLNKGTRDPNLFDFWDLLNSSYLILGGKRDKYECKYPV